MFAIALMLMSGMVCIEIMVVRNMPRFGAWLKSNALKSLCFSLALSFMLGLIFPAAGLVVFTAGVFSTIVVQPYYFFSRKYAEWKLAWQSSYIHSLYASVYRKDKVS